MNTSVPGADISLPGTLFIVSAPSGAGKTTLVQAVIKSLPNIQKSISHTTRAKRNGEIHEQDYYFVSEIEFKSLLKENHFLEHAEVFGHQYGTTDVFVKETLAKGIDVILEIDWQGARQIRYIYTKAQSIFILPPSLEVLEARLKNRHQDDEKTVSHRMQQAKTEIAHYIEYDYLIVNEHFDQALADFKSIILAERLRLGRQKNEKKALIEGLLKDY